MQLVRLLAAGLGDSAIQRALGVSASTVHRRVRALMSGLVCADPLPGGFQLGRTAAPLAERRAAPGARPPPGAPASPGPR